MTYFRAKKKKKIVLLGEVFRQTKCTSIWKEQKKMLNKVSGSKMGQLGGKKEYFCYSCDPASK